MTAYRRSPALTSTSGRRPDWRPRLLTTRSWAITSNRLTCSAVTWAPMIPRSAPAPADCSGRRGRSAFGRADLPATISLFERAGALLPEPEAAQLLPDLVQALFEAGRFADADGVLDEVIGRAQTDELLASRARVEQQFVRAHADSDAE